MANLGTLTLDITAKTGNFTGPISKAERDVQRFSKTLDKLAAEGSTSVDRLQRSFNTLNIKSGLQIDAEKQKLVSAFNAIKNSGVSSSAEIKRAYAAMNKGIKDIDPASKSAMSGLDSIKGAALAAFAGVSVQQFVTQLYQAGIEAQKLKTTFNAVFGQSLGATELAFVREEANRLGLELLSTSDAYMKLAASSRNTKLEGQATKDIFSAVASAGRALSLSTDQVNGAFVAIGQIMSKGTVQSEELKGQLSERLPGAFQIAARAMGVTTAELQKMLEQGQVISEDFLPKFALELQRTFPVGAEAMSGMSAETERLKTAWFELKKTVMEGGGESLFTKSILGMKDMVVEADSFYTKMSNALRVLKEIAKNPMSKEVGVGPQKVLPPPSKFDLNMIGGASVGQPLLEQVMNPSLIGPPVFPVDAAQRKFQEDQVKESEASSKRAKSAAESLTKSINSQVAALEGQAETLGWSEENIKFYELANKGATAEQLKSAKAALDSIKAFKDEEEALKSLVEMEIEAGEERADQNEKLKSFAANYANLLKSDQSGLSSSLIGSGSSDTAKKQMQEKLSIQQKYNEELSKLTEQFTTGDITQSLYEQESQIVRDSLSTRLKMQEEYYTQLSELQGNAALGASEALANYMDNAKNYSEIAKSFVNEQLGAMESGLSKALYNMITETQSLGDAFKTLGKSMADSMINALTDIAAKFLITQAMQLMFGKTAQLSAVATMTANAQATSLQAGIAAFASTAAIPIVGPLAAPGAMAAALAATQPVAAAVSAAALSGMAHSGIDSIPQDGTWLLKKGERVSTAETSAKLDRTLEDVSKKSSGGDAPIINMYEDKSKAGTVETRTQDDRRIIDIFVADLMGDGKAQKAMSRKFGLQTVGA